MIHTIELDEAQHIYRVNGVIKPGINAILRAAGHLDNMRGSQEAMDRGSTIHKYIEMANLGTLDEQGSDPAGLAFVNQWRRLLDEVGAIVYRDELGPFVERPLYSKRGDFCSAIDAPLIVPKFKLPVVVNIKSSRNVYPHYRVQLAAEAVLMAAHLGIRKPEKLIRWGVHLDGTDRRAKVEPYTKPKDFTDWWEAVEDYREQQKQMRKEAIA